MQTYEKPGGERFALTNSTPEEWADAIREKFVALGCSESYADEVADGIRQATPTTSAKPRR